MLKCGNIKNNKLYVVTIKVDIGCNPVCRGNLL